jgi:hypothetical protein
VLLILVRMVAYVSVNVADIIVNVKTTMLVGTVIEVSICMLLFPILMCLYVKRELWDTNSYVMEN